MKSKHLISWPPFGCGRTIQVLSLLSRRSLHRMLSLQGRYLVDTKRQRHPHDRKLYSTNGNIVCFLLHLTILAYTPPPARTLISKPMIYEPTSSSYRPRLLYSIISVIIQVGETKKSSFLHSGPGRMYLLPPNPTFSLQQYSDTGPAPTLQDKAIDSFGVSIGLVRFFGIQSRCGLTTSNAANVSEHAPEDNTGDEDLDDETLTDHIQPIATTKGEPVLESHPYIVSHWVASSDYRLIFISYTWHISLLSLLWT